MNFDDEKSLNTNFLTPNFFTFQHWRQKQPFWTNSHEYYYQSLLNFFQQKDPFFWFNFSRLSSFLFPPFLQNTQSFRPFIYSFLPYFAKYLTFLASYYHYVRNDLQQQLQYYKIRGTPFSIFLTLQKHQISAFSLQPQPLYDIQQYYDVHPQTISDRFSSLTPIEQTILSAYTTNTLDIELRNNEDQRQHWRYLSEPRYRIQNSLNAIETFQITYECPPGQLILSSFWPPENTTIPRFFLTNINDPTQWNFLSCQAADDWRHADLLHIFYSLNQPAISFWRNSRPLKSQTTFQAEGKQFRFSGSRAAQSFQFVASTKHLNSSSQEKLSTTSTYFEAPDLPIIFSQLTEQGAQPGPTIATADQLLDFKKQRGYWLFQFEKTEICIDHGQQIVIWPFENINETGRIEDWNYFFSMYSNLLSSIKQKLSFSLPLPLFKLPKIGFVAGETFETADKLFLLSSSVDIRTLPQKYAIWLYAPRTILSAYGKGAVSYVPQPSFAKLFESFRWNFFVWDGPPTEIQHVFASSPNVSSYEGNQFTPKEGDRLLVLTPSLFSGNDYQKTRQQLLTAFQFPEQFWEQQQGWIYQEKFQRWVSSRHRNNASLKTNVIYAYYRNSSQPYPVFYAYPKTYDSTFWQIAQWNQAEQRWQTLYEPTTALSTIASIQLEDFQIWSIEHQKHSQWLYALSATEDRFLAEHQSQASNIWLTPTHYSIFVLQTSNPLNNSVTLAWPYFETPILSTEFLSSLIQQYPPFTNGPHLSVIGWSVYFHPLTASSNSSPSLLGVFYQPTLNLNFQLPGIYSFSVSALISPSLTGFFAAPGGGALIHQPWTNNQNFLVSSLSVYPQTWQFTVSTQSLLSTNWANANLLVWTQIPPLTVLSSYPLRYFWTSLSWQQNIEAFSSPFILRVPLQHHTSSFRTKQGAYPYWTSLSLLSSQSPSRQIDFLQQTQTHTRRTFKNLWTCQQPLIGISPLDTFTYKDIYFYIRKSSLPFSWTPPSYYLISEIYSYPLWCPLIRQISKKNNQKQENEEASWTASFFAPSPSQTTFSLLDSSAQLLKFQFYNSNQKERAVWVGNLSAFKVKTDIEVHIQTEFTPQNKSNLLPWNSFYDTCVVIEEKTSQNLKTLAEITPHFVPSHLGCLRFENHETYYQPTFSESSFSLTRPQNQTYEKLIRNYEIYGTGAGFGLSEFYHTPQWTYLDKKSFFYLKKIESYDSQCFVFDQKALLSAYGYFEPYQSKLLRLCNPGTSIHELIWKQKQFPSNVLSFHGVENVDIWKTQQPWFQLQNKTIKTWTTDIWGRYFFTVRDNQNLYFTQPSFHATFTSPLCVYKQNIKKTELFSQLLLYQTTVEPHIIYFELLNEPSSQQITKTTFAWQTPLSTIDFEWQFIPEIYLQPITSPQQRLFQQTQFLLAIIPKIWTPTLTLSVYRCSCNFARSEILYPQFLDCVSYPLTAQTQSLLKSFAFSYCKTTHKLLWTFHFMDDFIFETTFSENSFSSKTSLWQFNPPSHIQQTNPFLYQPSSSSGFYLLSVQWPSIVTLSAGQTQQWIIQTTQISGIQWSVHDIRPIQPTFSDFANIHFSTISTVCLSMLPASAITWSSPLTSATYQITLKGQYQTYSIFTRLSVLLLKPSS